MPFVKLKALKWPQDNLTVPRGLGSMPPIEYGNRAVVGAEFFALSADFSMPHTLAALTTQTQILPTPQDGDFWCDQISVVSWLTSFAGQARNLVQYPDAMVTIKDVRTAKPLIFSPLFNTPSNQGFLIPKNSLPITFFRKFPPSGIDGDLTYSGSQPVPNGFRDVGTMIQPFLFTRQGGIEVTMTNNNVPPGGGAGPPPTLFDYTVTICFGGWKEYANASG